MSYSASLTDFHRRENHEERDSLAFRAKAKSAVIARFVDSDNPWKPKQRSALQIPHYQIFACDSNVSSKDALLSALELDDNYIKEMLFLKSSTEINAEEFRSRVARLRKELDGISNFGGRTASFKPMASQANVIAASHASIIATSKPNIFAVSNDNDSNKFGLIWSFFEFVISILPSFLIFVLICSVIKFALVSTYLGYFEFFIFLSFIAANISMAFLSFRLKSLYRHRHDIKH